MTRWQRASALTAVEQRDRLLLVGGDGAVYQLESETAALARAVLDFLVVPHSRDDVVAHVTALAGAPPERPSVIDELLALLEKAGAVLEAERPGRVAPARAGAGIRVLLGVTGAVGTLHAPVLIGALQRRGFVVRVAATRAALRFTSIAGLESLTHHRVVRSMWSRDPRVPVPHLELAAWADLVLVCPASATTLARLVAGDFTCVVAAAALATRAPVVIAPSMSSAMRIAPAVQRNLERLRADGFYVVPPAHGVEVAEAPASRGPILGTAPPTESLAELMVALARALAIAPRATGPIDWEAVHAEHVAVEADVVDEDVAAELDAHAQPPGLLLDVGAGSGALATHAARRGFQVVATDVSPTALARARARAGDLAITWLLDDITDTRLCTAFDVAVDRGCLHHLPALAHPRWAHALAGLVRPGGVLIVKTDAPQASAERATRKLTADELAILLMPAFALIASRPSSFPVAGAHGESVPATLAVLRRTRGD